VNSSAGSARWAGLELIVAVGLFVMPMDTYAQVDGRVTVHVVAEGTSGRPLGGARLAITAVGVAVTTGPDGVASLSGLAPGRYQLSVSALGFADEEAEIDVSNGRTSRLTIELAAAPIDLAGFEVASDRPPVAAGGVSIEVATLGPSVPDLPAAIDRVAGATVVRTGGPGSPVAVRLRGSSSSQVLVLLDGVPINSPITGTADLSTVDLESLDRVVVLPGSQSARYGPRALGGVILLETRRTNRASTALTVGAGSWGSREVVGSGTWPAHDRWTLSGGARWAESRGDFAYEVPVFRGGGEDTRANARHERIGGDARVEHRARVTTSLRVHGSRLERGSPGGVVQPSVTGHQRHERFGGTADAITGSATRGASIALGLQWQNAMYVDTAPPFGSAHDADTDVREQRLSAEGWTDAGRVRIRGGLEASSMDVSSTSITPGELTVAARGLWTRVTSDVNAGPTRLDLGAGLRADRHDLVTETSVSPSTDIAVSLGDTRLSVGWRHGFSPPGLGDLFFQEGVLVEPNPDLLPERVRNEIDVSLNQTVTFGAHALELLVSAYDADVDDMILWFPDYRFVWSPVNFDVARSGLETGGAATLRLLGAEHTISGNAAWSRVEYRDGSLDGQVAYQPDFTADASVSIDIGVGALTPTWRHVGERRSAAGSELNILAPYDLVDVGLALPLNLGSTTARLDLLASNILDERAALLVDYPLPGRGWSARVRISPQH
jgi:outer membrane cobalamin receptor